MHTYIVVVVTHTNTFIHAQYCSTSGYCTALAAQFACSTNADCDDNGMAKKKTCCSSVQKSIGAYCDGTKEAQVMALVQASKSTGQCADTDCLVVSSGSTLRLSMLLPALLAGFMTVKYAF
jgi:hypothetical protein